MLNMFAMKAQWLSGACTIGSARVITHVDLNVLKLMARRDLCRRVAVLLAIVNRASGPVGQAGCLSSPPFPLPCCACDCVFSRRLHFRAGGLRQLQRNLQFVGAGVRLSFSCRCLRWQPRCWPLPQWRARRCVFAALPPRFPGGRYWPMPGATFLPTARKYSNAERKQYV